MLPWAIAAIVLVLASLLARGFRRSIAGGLRWLANRVDPSSPFVVKGDRSSLQRTVERLELLDHLHEGEEWRREI